MDRNKRWKEEKIIVNIFKILKHRKIIALLFIISIIFSDVNVVKADSDGNLCEVGVLVVGDYSDWDDLGNLNAPIQIKKDVESAFKKGNAKGWSIGVAKQNKDVKINMFKGKSLGGKDNEFADNVDLLFWSGHGLKPNCHGASDYSLALDYSGGKKYAKQSEMYLGNKDLEWFVTFTCNFLKGGLDDVGHLAKGIHCVCGYQTGVILVSNMGKTMSNKLKKGISVKEAFFATADETQPWNDFSTRKAAVFTTTSCAADRIWGYGKQASDPKSYSQDSSDYIIYQYKY